MNEQTEFNVNVFIIISVAAVPLASSGVPRSGAAGAEFWYSQQLIIWRLFMVLTPLRGEGPTVLPVGRCMCESQPETDTVLRQC